MDERLKAYDEKMTKTMDNLFSELDAIRAGRANPHVLDHLRVDYYGAPTPYPAGGECLGSRGPHDSDCPLGAFSPEGD